MKGNLERGKDMEMECRLEMMEAIMKVSMLII